MISKLQKLLLVGLTLTALVLLGAAKSPTVYDNEQEALSSELQKLQEQVSEPGVYELTIAYKDASGNVVTKTIELNITPSVIDITAHDVRLPASELATMTDAQWISFAAASGVNSYSGAKVDLAVDSGKVRATAGSYELTFYSGASYKTVQVIITGDSTFQNNIINQYTVVNEVNEETWPFFTLLSNNYIRFGLALVLIFPFLLLISLYWYETRLLKQVEDEINN
ncbi:hypothetical protein [Culicoidibacter larvae]|uniref:Uncharacterized protein n=1 Tax=Culicoidibacter larvae TaxID=2579976 RepID=A0A5R8QE06_9FIRM|nr:hypothetical protein [Culicoidibacter larvae]TLG75434.1 hypothetical protein FEZ08_05130 [Culicoidibacter larvae]